MPNTAELAEMRKRFQAMQLMCIGQEQIPTDDSVEIKMSFSNAWVLEMETPTHIRIYNVDVYHKPDAFHNPSDDAEEEHLTRVVLVAHKFESSEREEYEANVKTLFDPACVMTKHGIDCELFVLSDEEDQSPELVSNFEEAQRLLYCARLRSNRRNDCSDY